MLAAVGGLLLFAFWEAIQPFRTPVTPKARHYLVNITLGTFNALVLNITLSSFVVVYYKTLSDRGIGLLNALGLGPWANIALSLVFLDFVTYAWHWAYHEIPSFGGCTAYTTATWTWM